MKITKEQLKQLIKEEVKRVLSELEEEDMGRTMLDQAVRGVINDIMYLNEMPSTTNDEYKGILDNAQKVVKSVDDAYDRQISLMGMGDEEKEDLENALESLKELLEEAIKLFESDIEIEDYDYETSPDIEEQVILPTKRLLDDVGEEEEQDDEEESYDDYMRYRNPSLREGSEKGIDVPEGLVSSLGLDNELQNKDLDREVEMKSDGGATVVAGQRGMKLMKDDLEDIARGDKAGPQTLAKRMLRTLRSIAERP